VKKNMPQPDRANRGQTGEVQPGQQQARAEDEPSATNVVVEAVATSTVKEAEASREDLEKQNALEKFLEEWQSAMDDNDDARIRAESMKIMRHPDPEVRKHAVDGFSWIGAKGLVPLAEMMYDRNRSVARQAAEAWMDEMREMKDDATKAEILGLAAAGGVDRLDEETFNELLSLFDDLPEHLAAKQIYDLLQTSQKPDYIESMLDALGFIIQPDEPFGETFTEEVKTIIEDWLKNPENADEPEDKEDGNDTDDD